MNGEKGIEEVAVGLGNQGFTLIETLMAMTITAAILLPASFWLYRSRTSQAALGKFRGTRALEAEMERAILVRLDHDSTFDLPSPYSLRLILHIERDGNETRLLGKALDRRGHPISELEAAYFGMAP